MPERSLKILHITRGIDPIGGCEIYIRNLMKASRALGHEVLLLTATAPKNPLFDQSISIHCINEISSYEHKMARKSVQELSLFLSNAKPDLIHIHDLNNPYVIQYCGQNYPTIKTTLNADAYCGGTDKYLYTSGKECNFRLGYGCLAIAYYENCMSRHPKRSLEIISIKKKSLAATKDIFRIVVPSIRSKEILMQQGISVNRISVIPLFAFQSKLPLAPYPSGKPKILFLGRLRPYKGVSYLLRALRKITIPFELLIVGDGEDRDELKELCQMLDLTDRVRFLGNQPHEAIDGYLDECSLLVVPSTYPDSFPTVGLEAMARARPVVGFSTGGIPDWLADGQTGYLVKPQDFVELAKKIEYLLLNRDGAERMGLEGKRRTVQYFTEEPHMQQISRLYVDAVRLFSKPKITAR